MGQSRPPAHPGTPEAIRKTEGNARSFSLDLFAQWNMMEGGRGKWRFTSPTHTVRAFHQDLLEIEEDGGIAVRHARDSENHRVLVEGMTTLGFAACSRPNISRNAAS